MKKPAARLPADSNVAARIALSNEIKREHAVQKRVYAAGGGPRFAVSQERVDQLREAIAFLAELAA